MYQQSSCHGVRAIHQNALVTCIRHTKFRHLLAKSAMHDSGRDRLKVVSEPLMVETHYLAVNERDGLLGTVYNFPCSRLEVLVSPHTKPTLPTQVQQRLRYCFDNMRNDFQQRTCLRRPCANRRSQTWLDLRETPWKTRERLERPERTVCKSLGRKSGKVSSFYSRGRKGGHAPRDAVFGGHNMQNSSYAQITKLVQLVSSFYLSPTRVGRYSKSRRVTTSVFSPSALEVSLQLINCR